MDVGQKIKNARLAKNMTQEELGNLLGVKKSAIAKYESGRVVNLKRTTLKQLALILDLNGSDLIDEIAIEETEKDNDTMASIIVRMKNDKNFRSLVETINNMDSNKISAVTNMLNAFL